jgi:hypothetical protein
MNTGIFAIKSSKTALIFNGKPAAMLRPWHMIVDVERRLLTIKRRNWHFISSDEETFAFKSVRNIKIDTHIFGADVSIQLFAGEATGYYMSKKNAKKIQNLLLNDEWNRNDTDVFINTH